MAEPVQSFVFSGLHFHLLSRRLDHLLHLPSRHHLRLHHRPRSPQASLWQDHSQFRDQQSHCLHLSHRAISRRILWEPRHQLLHLHPHRLLDPLHLHHLHVLDQRHGRQHLLQVQLDHELQLWELWGQICALSGLCTGGPTLTLPHCPLDGPERTLLYGPTKHGCRSLLSRWPLGCTGITLTNWARWVLHRCRNYKISNILFLLFRWKRRVQRAIGRPLLSWPPPSSSTFTAS